MAIIAVIFICVENVSENDTDKTPNLNFNHKTIDYTVYVYIKAMY